MASCASLIPLWIPDGTRRAALDFAREVVNGWNAILIRDGISVWSSRCPIGHDRSSCQLLARVLVVEIARQVVHLDYILVRIFRIVRSSVNDLSVATCTLNLPPIQDLLVGRCTAKQNIRGDQSNAHIVKFAHTPPPEFDGITCVCFVSSLGAISAWRNLLAKTQANERGNQKNKGNSRSSLLSPPLSFGPSESSKKGSLSFRDNLSTDRKGIVRYWRNRQGQENRWQFITEQIRRALRHWGFVRERGRNMFVAWRRGIST